MITPADIAIEAWRPGVLTPTSVDEDLDMLSALLHMIVYEGAGVTFVDPFTLDDARVFWRDNVLRGVGNSHRGVLLARSGRQIVGTVQLDFTMPPNQRHRAEVCKLLVHPSRRRCGIGRALMTAVEQLARSEGRTLLTLDTWTGGVAARLYESLGYVTLGVIPRFARGSTTTELLSATLMYKELS